METTNKGAINFLRWGAVVPASVVAFLVSYWVSIIINSITMIGFIGPDSLFGKIYITFIASAISGFVFVYAAQYVAPSHKKQIAIIFAIAAIFLMGASASLGLVAGEYGSFLAIISTIAGAIAAGYHIYTEDDLL